MCYMQKYVVLQTHVTECYHLRTVLWGASCVTFTHRNLFRWNHVYGGPSAWFCIVGTLVRFPKYETFKEWFCQCSSSACFHGEFGIWTQVSRVLIQYSTHCLSRSNWEIVSKYSSTRPSTTWRVRPDYQSAYHFPTQKCLNGWIRLIFPLIKSQNETEQKSLPNM